MTAILYLNPGWTAADGGQLRLYPHQRGTHYDVEPIGKGRRTSLMRVPSLLGVGCQREFVLFIPCSKSPRVVLVRLPMPARSHGR